MPKTPDRFPGSREEEALLMEASATTPTVNGEMRYVTGVGFRFYEEGAEVGLSGSGLSTSQHNALRQLIHFLDDGPGDGFASGTYKEITYTGLLVTNETWYTDNTKVDKIVQLDITYTGLLPTSEVWKMYDTDGSTVLVTLTDSITYSGVLEQDRTRTWA